MTLSAQTQPKRRNPAARHAYVSRKKPGTTRLSYDTLKQVSAIVGGWNAALFAYAQTKEPKAGSICCEEVADGDTWVVVPVCPLYAWCKSETRKGYDVACAWTDLDMTDAIQRATMKGGE